MKVTLVVANGPSAGKSVPVPVSPFGIGRAPECQLRPASRFVSHRHCSVRLRDGSAVVQDLGSTNGTFVNGARVTGEAELRDGDHLQVGPLLFQVEVEGGTPSSTPRFLTLPQPAGVMDSPEAILLDPGEAAPHATLDGQAVSDGRTERILPPAESPSEAAE